MALHRVSRFHTRGSASTEQRSRAPRLQERDLSRRLAAVPTCHVRDLVAYAALIVMPGCSLAPSVNILGSFFPAWLISIITGVVLTVIARQVFIATAIDPHLRPSGFVYPSLACLLTFASWLILFGG